MSTQITRSMVILVTIVVAILSVFVGFTPAGRAQDPLNPNPNVNANAQNSDTQSKPSRKGRQRAEAKPKTDTTPNPSAAATTPTDQPVQRTATTAPTTQTDLSGTYVGVLDCADAG